MPKPAASSLARLIRKPEDNRSTESAILLCALCKFLEAHKEATLELRTAAMIFS
jgi:hypothetical protein